MIALYSCTLLALAATCLPVCTDLPRLHMDAGVGKTLQDHIDTHTNPRILKSLVQKGKESAHHLHISISILKCWRIINVCNLKPFFPLFLFEQGLLYSPLFLFLPPKCWGYTSSNASLDLCALLGLSWASLELWSPELIFHTVQREIWFQSSARDSVCPRSFVGKIFLLWTALAPCWKSITLAGGWFLPAQPHSTDLQGCTPVLRPVHTALATIDLVRFKFGKCVASVFLYCFCLICINCFSILINFPKNQERFYIELINYSSSDVPIFQFLPLGCFVLSLPSCNHRMAFHLFESLISFDNIFPPVFTAQILYYYCIYS